MFNLIEDFYRSILGLSKLERLDEHVDFKKLIEEGATLLDVRRDEEYEMGHIENAIHIPVEELKSRLAEIEAANLPILVYCRSGRRSGKAKKILNKAGLLTFNAGGYKYLSKKI